MRTNNVYEELKKLRQEIKDQVSKDEILSLKEASNFLGCSTSYLYKLTSSGQIPHYKPSGKKLYFSLKELIGWIKRKKVSTGYEINKKALNYTQNRKS